ncbi:hypothetical protein P7I82_24575 [Pseudomonas aeruginosa]|uniref:hypothetical protein n=1 Tax=Pseudomonas aeruginosa TaxID=287 RepID=UPI00249A527F|nr:hypothetical protein [Pseudomonas aeruginosa]WGX34929.1 hypothetical protein P7I82_24575 [Pseudomonas aeruginosa]WGX60821.1 hypothetical protein P7I95_25145 [Pseudomonas aeruginosa]WLV45926.1 hypothetical protein L4H25_08335 [Pseudomonas aeruginosa]WLV55968.1 hypothetical protein L4Z88_24880 [Pseudomonas aeruginosa]WPE36601.1 hypothetical protein MML24_08420 [Pseudomonas aeruginosa]
MTFEIPEEMEWATYDASRVWQISKGGGHNFTAEVTAVGDNGSYDYDSMIFYVSEKVDKSEFHNASNYIKGTAEIYQDHLRENIKLDKKAISTLQKNKSEEKSIERIKKGIAEMEGRPQKLSATPDHFGKVLPHVLSRTQRHRARHDPDRPVQWLQPAQACPADEPQPLDGQP